MKRERRMPFFLLASMVLHALLFLIAPKVISGMFPATHVGEQGGLTYVTLVDAPQSQQPRASVAEAARRPQARPTPQVLPTPVNAQAAPAQPSAAPQPAPPVPQPPETPSVQTQPTPAPRPPEPRPDPVLTGPRGDVPVADTPVAEDDLETTPSVPEEGGSGSDGTDVRDEVASIPGAEIDPEPQLPPSGESMLSSFGGSTFPKNAVGLFRGSIEVEVAAIVSSEGRLIDVVVVNGSGISVVDTHAENVVRHLIQFRPYDAVYEMRVFITFNSADQDRLHFRYSEFITSPPSIGRYDAEGGL